MSTFISRVLGAVAAVGLAGAGSLGLAVTAEAAKPAPVAPLVTVTADVVETTATITYQVDRQVRKISSVTCNVDGEPTACPSPTAKTSTKKASSASLTLTGLSPGHHRFTVSFVLTSGEVAVEQEGFTAYSQASVDACTAWGGTWRAPTDATLLWECINVPTPNPGDFEASHEELEPFCVADGGLSLDGGDSPLTYWGCVSPTWNQPEYVGEGACEVLGGTWGASTNLGWIWTCTGMSIQRTDYTALKGALMPYCTADGGERIDGGQDGVDTVSMNCEFVPVGQDACTAVGGIYALGVDPVYWNCSVPNGTSAWMQLQEACIHDRGVGVSITYDSTTRIDTHSCRRTWS